MTETVLGGSAGVAARAPQMRSARFVVEFEIIAEHWRADALPVPSPADAPRNVEDDIGAFEAHLGGIARGKVLHMHGRRNHGTGNSQPLGDVSLHLGAQHQFGLQFGDPGLDLEIIVADQGLDTPVARRRPALRARIRGYRLPMPTTWKPSSSAATRAAAMAWVASPNTKTRLPVR